MGNEAPFGILNNDVLGYIFVLLAQDPERNENDWNWYSIAHVCRHWRTVALDTGAFWSNILCHSTSLQMINMQLSRSKKTDLSFTFVQLFDAVRPTNFDEILTAVLAHKERITYMYIKTYNSLWYEFHGFTKPFCRNLKSLYVELLNRPGADHSLLASIDLRDILCLKDLRTLSLINLHLWMSSHSAMQPLNDLADLSFDNIRFGWRNLYQVMRTCPNLEKLRIVFARGQQGTEFEENRSYMTISSPRLRNLKIHGLSTSQLRTLLQDLDLPASSNWDLRCIAPSSLTFHSYDDTLELHKTMISSVFSRHTYSGTLHIAFDFSAILFRATSSLGSDDDTAVTTDFTLDHQLTEFTSTNSERCAFVTHLIRDTHWRNAKNFEFQSKSGTSPITSDKWVDLLASFDLISSLEVFVPYYAGQYLTELSAALKYAGDHGVINPTLENLSFIMTRYDEGFVQNLKLFLDSARRKSAKILKLRLEYPTEVQTQIGANIGSLKESLSGYAQEVRVDVRRSIKLILSSD